MNIRPFAAVRPVQEFAAQVAAVPYDVVDTAEARALASGNPKSFLHVSRPEIDMPDGSKWIYPSTKGVISLQTTRDTNYETYIQVQNELTRVFS